MNKLEALKQFFGHSGFRPGQEALADALLNGRDALGVMPTGAGKSVCYQLPALLLPGITLVVSPLISLMKDQVAALGQAGIPAAYINSSLSAAQHREVFRRAAQRAYKIIYVAPERLLTEGFLRFAEEAQISLLAVDEAHCVSQWGQDFRPSYLGISEFVELLQRRPVVGAFTATATGQVKEDIRRLLRLEDPVQVTTGYDRPNLYFEVAQPKKKDAWLWEFLSARNGQSGIIYCATRKNVESVCEGLTRRGITATRYHAGLSGEERQQNQEDFVYDRARVMVATNAFGMGIDKSNVSFVVHYNMPKNLESYYQEAGRAGRDGGKAECFLLYSPGDVRTAQYLLRNSPGNEELTIQEQETVLRRDLERLEKMIGYCTTGECLRAYILEYFGESFAGGCGNCGSCRAEYIKRDMTVEAQKILSAVARVEKKYSYGLGAAAIIGLLRGSRAQRTVELGLDKLPTYGTMRELSRQQIREYIDFLVSERYLELTGGEYPVLRLAGRAGDVLFHGDTVTYREKVSPTSVKKSGYLLNGGGPSVSGESLLDTLKVLRAQFAQDENVPAYIVFSNAALTEMADKRPRDMNQFLQISGVGYVKAARYGTKFLETIAAWEDHNK